MFFHEFKSEEALDGFVPSLQFDEASSSLFDNVHGFVLVDVRLSLFFVDEQGQCFIPVADGFVAACHRQLCVRILFEKQLLLEG